MGGVDEGGGGRVRGYAEQLREGDAAATRGRGDRPGRDERDGPRTGPGVVDQTGLRLEGVSVRVRVRVCVCVCVCACMHGSEPEDGAGGRFGARVRVWTILRIGCSNNDSFGFTPVAPVVVSHLGRSRSDSG